MERAGKHTVASAMSPGVSGGSGGNAARPHHEERDG